eukprot:symbB.v1.2.034375.t1/scaffold4424.1/size65192/1
MAECELVSISVTLISGATLQLQVGRELDLLADQVHWSISADPYRAKDYVACLDTRPPMASGPKLAFVVCLVVITILLSDLASGLISQWNPVPELTWGLVSRGFGVVYLIVFGSFHGQVVPLCGCKGVTPVAQFLAQAFLFGNSRANAPTGSAGEESVSS